MPIESFSKSARVPCSCGGENGSCFRCDGTGLYLPALVLNVVSFLSAAVSAESLRALTEARRLAEARLHLTKRPISKTKAQSKKRQADAGMTLKFLPNRALAWTTSSRAPTEARGPAGKRPQPEKLSEPRTSSTQQAAAGMLQQRPAPLTDKTTFTARLERQVPFTFGRCPDCNQVLPQGDIARHQKRLHPNRMVAVALWTPPMTTCPDCGGTARKGELPHCVSACPNGVFMFGDLNEDSVTNGAETFRFSELIKDKSGYRLMEDLGTKPRVYYLPPVNRNFPFESGLENQNPDNKKTH